MPFYEYECQDCKFYTELMQKISDPPLEKCPSCGKKTMQKLISAPNFRLKGGGWYETDFKGDGENKRNLAGADKEESKTETTADSAAKPTETKAESKPAATESKPAAEPKRQSASSGGGRSAPAARPPAAGKGKSKQAAKAVSKPSAKSKPKAKAKAKAKKGRR